MIDHTGLTVSDFGRSKTFYARAFAPIGYELLLELPAAVTGHSDVAGFGVPPRPDFWIVGGKPNVPPIHVAFRVASRTLVDAFYTAAIAAGGRDNGAPGLRPLYHPNYYGAFVLDPDGTGGRQSSCPAKMIVVRPDILLDAVHASAEATGKCDRASSISTPSRTDTATRVQAHCDD